MDPSVATAVALLIQDNSRRQDWNDDIGGIKIEFRAQESKQSLSLFHKDMNVTLKNEEIELYLENCLRANDIAYKWPAIAFSASMEN